MINELIEAFATGFCVGAVGATAAVIVWIIYEAIKYRKDKKSGN